MFEKDYQKLTQDTISWIKEVTVQQGFSDVVVALSGGIDSSVVATLLVQALGKEHVYALCMPYGTLSTNATEDALLMTSHLGLSSPHVETHDIQDSVDTLAKSLAVTDPIRLGNIMARMRMIVLYDFAKKHSLLVCGTENKSEQYLGYYTRFGDEASDIEPIRALYKTQVYALAKYLGIPKKIQEKSPTANLWEGQTDENQFGFSYEDADKVLYLSKEKGLSAVEIMNQGVQKEVVESVLHWVEKNEFKQRVPFVKE